MNWQKKKKKKDFKVIVLWKSPVFFPFAFNIILFLFLYFINDPFWKWNDFISILILAQDHFVLLIMSAGLLE